MSNKGDTLEVSVHATPRMASAGAATITKLGWDACGNGKNIIHTGGPYDSYLLLPMISG